MTARNLTLELNSIKNEDEIDKLIQSFKQKNLIGVSIIKKIKTVKHF